MSQWAWASHDAPIFGMQCFGHLWLIDGLLVVLGVVVGGVVCLVVVVVDRVVGFV